MCVCVCDGGFQEEVVVVVDLPSQRQSLSLLCMSENCPGECDLILEYLLAGNC